MNRFSSFLLFSTILLLFASCGWRNVRGNGNVTTSTRSHRGFTAVKTAGSFDVYVTQGSQFEVKVEAEENLLNYILTEVDGDVLEIKVKQGVNLRPRKDMKIYITAPAFRGLSIAGSGNIISSNRLSYNGTMKFSIAGSGDIQIPEVDAPEVTVKIAGSGNVEVNGSTRSADYRISGSGDIKCSNLKAENASVHIAGSGGVWLFASQELDVHIAGGGDVYYRGNPPQIKKRIAGSGNLVAQ